LDKVESKGIEGGTASNPTEASASAATWQAAKPTVRARLKGVANWVAEHELWVVVPAALVLTFPKFVGQSIVTLALAAIPILWFCRWAGLGYLTLGAPLNLPMLLMLMMLPLALWASADRELTEIALYQFLAGVALYFAFMNRLKSERDLSLGALAVALVGVGLALLAPIATRWNTSKLFTLPAVYEHLLIRLPDSINANVLGGALAITIPVLVVVWWEGGLLLRSRPMGHLSRLLGLPVVIAVLIAFTLTQSRGAYLALLFALLLLILGYSRKGLYLGFIVIALTVVAVTRLGSRQVADILLTTDTIQGVGGRQEVWSRAFYMLQDFPYTGVGLGTFGRVASVLYPFFLIGPDADVPHAHNLFLQVGTDLGLPGLVAFIALLTVALLMIGQGLARFRRHPKPALERLAWGLLCSLVVLILHGLFDAVSWGSKPAVLPWMILGLVAGQYRVAVSLDDER